MLLLYLETRCVDSGGRVEDSRMRGAGFPCRLRNDNTIPGHSDYDCLEDMRAAGLLIGGERNTFRAFRHEGGPDPKVEPRAGYALTDSGWTLAHALRRWRAVGSGLYPVESVLRIVKGGA